MKYQRILFHSYGIINGLICVLCYYFFDKVPYSNIVGGVFWTIPFIPAIFGGYALSKIFISLNNKKFRFSLISICIYLISFYLFSDVFDKIDRYLTRGQVVYETTGGDVMLFFGTIIYYTIGFMSSYLIALLLWGIKSNRKV